MIRLMMSKDLEAAASIEKHCFSQPWSRQMIEAGITCFCDTYLVMEVEHNIIGYGVLRVLGEEGEIQRIAVLPEWRRLGYARKLLDAMVILSRKKAAVWMILEVRESNVSARKLYRSYGFREEGVRKSYYSNPSEDAILMRLALE